MYKVLICFILIIIIMGSVFNPYFGIVVVRVSRGLIGKAGFSANNCIMRYLWSFDIALRAFHIRVDAV